MRTLLAGLAHLQGLQFTGMGAPMGVYEEYDTDVCQDGGKLCVARDNEGYYGAPGTGGVNAALLGADGLPHCPPAFDCNGVPPAYWHANDGVTHGLGS
eukprot:CAMPEP_0184326324 /NCGR_PEP_ID=MMETSP1049-20130417/142503_1 /TAXON_ID=77928 /ORGANISM="Proteomonas sulcata, Strain CCMP704" /LENGTH=97 /DNA_ID=CAMNT_0026648511 /DNA_START=547 /DNA_END=840 /DNA_ORIENTATION=-